MIFNALTSETTTWKMYVSRNRCGLAFHFRIARYFTAKLEMITLTTLFLKHVSSVFPGNSYMTDEYTDESRNCCNK